VLWIVVAALVAAVPWLGGGTYWTRQLILIALLSLITSGLNLSFGYAGELALGQPAMYAAGAYTAGWFVKSVENDLLLATVVGAAAALVVGLISGIPGLRLGGWMLAITSMFLVVLIPTLIQLFPTTLLGGNSGLTGIPLPSLFGRELEPNDYYLFVVIVTVLWFAVFRNLVRSRYGAAMLVLRQSPLLAGSLGMSVYRLKLQAYAISAIPAGIAGAMFANLDGFVAPESFSLDFGLGILAASILGGSSSVYGVFIGAALLQLGPLRAQAFDKYSLVVYGAFLIVGGLLLRGGLAGLSKKLYRRAKSWRRRGGPVRPEAEFDIDAGALRGDVPAVTGEVLTLSGVTKRFGGVAALDGVSFEARPGEITALIGPNGSGKTTMLNSIGGFHHVDSGTISLGGREITSRSPATVSQLGVARTFQTPAIPKDLTVQEVLTSARFTSDRVSLFSTSLRLPSYLHTVSRDKHDAEEILRATGLWNRRHELASDLALGTRRMLELARVLARRPKLILLDEVASGLDVDEVTELADILREVRRAGATIVLVEHNFSLVRSLSDQVVVLAEGKLVTSGTPAEVEAHPEVRRHYLGEGAALSGTTLAGTQSGGGDV
jgi:branched-chain amino acid transport system permease protein